MAKKILIIGDTIVDKDINLKAIGLSLESPTMKTSYIDDEVNFGGAANVARYASYFGADITFVTCMSKKSESRFLKKNKVSLLNLDDSVENTKSRFYIKHGNERYKYLQINNTNNKNLNLDIDLDLNKYDAIAFSDYRCGLISQNMIKKSLKSTAKTYGASQISSHRSNFARYMDMDYLVCNEKEANSFLRRVGVLITKGEAGCVLNGITYAATLIDKPQNLIGAGDCFYAAYLTFDDPEKANKCAADYINGKI
tara:strand:+ start:59 stop:820 length:762 start_codon:yes stop_codon:yes gene_type:complete